jgi:hypothetical protein
MITKTTKLITLETAYATWDQVLFCTCDLTKQRHCSCSAGRVTADAVIALKDAINTGMAPPALREGEEPFKGSGTDEERGTCAPYYFAAVQALAEGDEFVMPILSARKKRAQRISSLLGPKRDSLDEDQLSWLVYAEREYTFCKKRIHHFLYRFGQVLDAIDAAGREEAGRIRDEERRVRDAERAKRDAAEAILAKARMDLKSSAAQSPMKPKVLARPIGGIPRTPQVAKPVPATAQAQRPTALVPKPATVPQKKAAPPVSPLGQEMLKTFKEVVEISVARGVGRTEASLGAAEDSLDWILTEGHGGIKQSLLKNELMEAVVATLKPFSTGEKDAVTQAKLWMEQTEAKILQAAHARRKVGKKSEPVYQNRTEADVTARPVAATVEAIQPVEEDIVAEMLRKSWVPALPTAQAPQA